MRQAAQWLWHSDLPVRAHTHTHQCQKSENYLFLFLKKSHWWVKWEELGVSPHGLKMKGNHNECPHSALNQTPPHSLVQSSFLPRLTFTLVAVFALFIFLERRVFKVGVSIINYLWSCLGFVHCWTNTMGIKAKAVHPLCPDPHNNLGVSHPSRTFNKNKQHPQQQSTPPNKQKPNKSPYC